tara:strand:+ start:241 stop:672 length:432 start_codon:yes stop_codon:yes gene_type:complete
MNSDEMSGQSTKDRVKKDRDYKCVWESEMMTCRHIEEKVLDMRNKFHTLIDDCVTFYKCIPDKKVQEGVLKGIHAFRTDYDELIKDITDFREQRQRSGWQKYGPGTYLIAMLKFNQEYAPEQVTENDVKILEQLEKNNKKDDA